MGVLFQIREKPRSIFVLGIEGALLMLVLHGWAGAAYCAIDASVRLVESRYAAVHFSSGGKCYLPDSVPFSGPSQMLSMASAVLFPNSLCSLKGSLCMPCQYVDPFLNIKVLPSTILATPAASQKHAQGTGSARYQTPS